MLFVPNEDYTRLPDFSSCATSTDVTNAASVADDDDDEGNNGDEPDVFVENLVSPSILFASQAQYLGHSNQVKTRQIIILFAQSTQSYIVFRMTIHEQDRQGCRPITAALTRNLNQIHQYSKVHVITIIKT